MYEAEVNDRVESIATLPVDVRSRFAEYRKQVVARTILPWGEHCTECVWPTCYQSCELYSPRTDGACRQFIGGVTRLDHSNGLSPYISKIKFKQWAKLWTVGNLRLESLESAEKSERRNITLGAIGRNAPLPHFIKPKVLQKLSYRRRVAAEKAVSNGQTPDFFLLECFNPNQREINLTFTIRPRDRKQVMPFQHVIQTAPGYTRTKIAVAEIVRAVDLSQAFEIEIVPNAAENMVLYFGLMDFVKEIPSQPTPQAATPAAHTFKCIVWDLDNTLWDGILIEDGPEKVRLREDVVRVIKETDRRGILHSVASKNNHDDAMQALKQFGLAEYFLYPQISWQPKSQSIAAIAKLLNIGVDTLAFVDDQPFEREEVKATLNSVTVIDAAQCQEITGRPECQVPITSESQNRRLMYREQEQRQVAQDSFAGDYVGFLRSCQMQVAIHPLMQSNLKRVYELAQRTNQMNFSGNRYQETQLLEIMDNPDLETYVIDCNDRFGQYGIVGFAVVDTREPRLLDLMFSCRVQAKRVEHAVLSFLLKRFVSSTNKDFYANYRKTAKNTPGGRVFEEMGFEAAGETAGVLSLVFHRSAEIPDDHIVNIVLDGSLERVAI